MGPNLFPGSHHPRAACNGPLTLGRHATYPPPPRGLAVAEKPDSQDICLPAGRYDALVGNLRPDAAQAGEFIYADGCVLSQRQGLGQAAWDGSAELVRVVLDEPGGIAPGQACAMYDGDRVLGGGFLRARLSVDTDRAAA